MQEMTQAEYDKQRFRCDGCGLVGKASELLESEEDDPQSRCPRCGSPAFTWQ